jgi:hypothetical protein
MNKYRLNDYFTNKCKIFYLSSFVCIRSDKYKLHISENPKQDMENIRDYRLMYHYLKVVSMSYLNTDEYYIYYKTNAYNAFVPLQSI